MQTGALLTAEELLHLSLPDKRAELVQGRLVVSEPPGYAHGRVTARLAKVLMDYVDARGLGVALAAETGFKLTSDPDTVRAPDAAFIRRDRLPDASFAGYAELAPDLVVEVLSPGDRAGHVLAKVADWLSAGSALVWVVDPERRQLRVYRADGTVSVLGEEESLDGEHVLAGLVIPIASIL